MQVERFRSRGRAGTYAVSVTEVYVTGVLVRLRLE